MSHWFRSCIVLSLICLSLVACTHEGNITPQTGNNASNSPVVVTLSSSSKSLKVGDTLSVEVSLDTNQNSVLTGSVFITFDPKVLDFKRERILTSNSAFRNWVEKDVESNRVELSFGEPNPGINKNNALVATLSAEVIGNGETKVEIAPTSIILDATNTNLLGKENTPLELTLSGAPKATKQSEENLTNPDSQKESTKEKVNESKTTTTLPKSVKPEEGEAAE